MTRGGLNPFQHTGGFDGTVDRRTAADGLRADGSFFDPEFQAYVVPVVLGHHRISSRADDMLVTTLGSCVAACIHDPVALVGGMNHFLLPGSPVGDGFGVATRYGSVAMERLINDLLARGARRERLEVKLFGGARVIETSLDVGAANRDFALDYVRREGLALAGEDLGGPAGRRVHFFPTTGKAFRRLLRPETERETVHQELDFLKALKGTAVEGEMELFDRG
ncbi:chemotaxis protein [Azospirillum rugosum]|uniref:Probable chemoreceptor glutamine deamidase CheD n=1 Tax=Azospirillum rugosum TaxID=416170 RepID=A0ABS4SS68_9PROT|nr:chemotaxis protein [Azospirillum rugosum]MBP2295287.1 chemotaxis protein CheD [Azospirillum rugosum]MDQ0528662.1 chemotaxis protein CheD [Azospirillum rugosum]